MELVELVVETALRAVLYDMEAELGHEAAKANDQYRRLDKRLADLEAKHVAEISAIIGLGRP